jgi:hypothetical protein
MDIYNQKSNKELTPQNIVIVFWGFTTVSVGIICKGKNNINRSNFTHYTITSTKPA